MFTKVGFILLFFVFFILLDPFPNIPMTLKVFLGSMFYLLGAYLYYKEVRTILPFFAPFIYLSLLIDSGLADSYPLSFVMAAMLPMAFLFPPLVVAIWNCPPLQNRELRERCETIAKKAHFTYPKIREWIIPSGSMTAALVGIFPGFRYILFTKKLLGLLPPESIEAVLAHEIGHSKNFHPLWLPFILSGVLLPLFMFELSSFPEVIAYCLFAALYFRLIFGFYSRLFERQADLYGLKVGIPLMTMIETLDKIGHYSGQIHKNPSWHHFSLAERIDFLKAVEANPELAKTHNDTVIFWQLIYATAFIIFFML